jgi:hypothetical protein
MDPDGVPSVTQPIGHSEHGAEEGGDEELLNLWHGKLTREIQQMRDCGPLEAMKRLDSLFRAAAAEGGAQAMRALGLAWVRVLAGPPESLLVPVIRSAGSLFISPARGPLLAHVYGARFWPPLMPDDPTSRFTDLQRRAILLALADLTRSGGREADLLHPVLADWLLNRALARWRKARPGLLQRLLCWTGRRSKLDRPLAVLMMDDSAGPEHGLTLRELRSHSLVLGRISPEDRVVTYATLLANCPVPRQRPDGTFVLKPLEEGLHGDFLRGWLTEHHQGTLSGDSEQLTQLLPGPFATDDGLIKQIADHLKRDLA